MNKTIAWCLAVCLAGTPVAPALAVAPQAVSRTGNKVAAQLKKTQADLASQTRHTQALRDQVASLQKQQQTDKQTLKQQDQTIAELRKQLAELKKTAHDPKGSGH